MNFPTAKVRTVTSALRDFTKMETSGGISLAIATIAAMICANSALSGLYEGFLQSPVVVQVGDLKIAKPLILWINDGLMAIFFFLIGLEVKREFMVGELSEMKRVMLPAIGAVGGLIVPALIYVAINTGNADNINGWAIPAATDIAFALAVLSLFGKRVPISLKILLLAIAIFDDLAAIIIIALFYTSQLSLEAIGGAVIPLIGLFVINRMGVTKLAPYVVLGIILWVLVLKSGVHATLAGVVTGLFVPMLKVKPHHKETLLENVEHGLHYWVAFGILPLFAFANAGVSLSGIGVDSFVEPVKLGISMGLLVGKQIGIFGAMYLALWFGLAKLPAGTRLVHLYGVAILGGIGFTMSLFIGSLAFEHANFEAPIRLGVLTGSLASALLGYVVLAATLPSAEQVQAIEDERSKLEDPRAMSQAPAE
ncbi:MAG: Na+/H+ antiporter NhaA [Pseudomonadota bacterium]